MAMTLRLTAEDERVLALLAESEGVSRQEATVRAIHEAIGRVPGVLSAHLVCHIADPGAAGPARAGGAS